MGEFVEEAAFLFEHVSDPIIVVDREFRVIRVNPGFRKFFRITEDVAAGMRSCDLFKELSSSRCNEACMRVIKKEVESNKWVEVPDEHCPHFDYVYPIFDEKGSFQKAILIVKHVSSQGQAVESKTSSDQSTKEAFLQTIYHDLASPIQVIRACTDVVAMELEADAGTRKEIVRDMLEASRRNERRLYEMVRTLRMIPRLEEEDIFEAEPVRPDKILRAVVSDFRLLLRNDVALESDVPSSIPEVAAAPDLLTRIFFNLLDNAARYTRSGGRIAISVEHTPGDASVIFKVFDDGEAISSEAQSRLFQKTILDPASQGPASRRDHGWGLYFCRLTIERFGGTIRVESREGWGTQFSFTLPAAHP
jgi:PAS domain S-box-containing protein